MQNIINGYTVPVKMTVDHTYDLMRIAAIAIAASGTATLETSLLGLPTVIVYKLAPLTYFLGKFLVKIPNIGLPNIIAGRKIVPELLQDDANPDNIAQTALAILTDAACRARIVQDLAAVKDRLGETGAVDRVAKVILEVAETGRRGKP